MGKPFIVHGDTSSHGGRVIAQFHGFDIDGKEVARLNDIFMFPIHGTQHIVGPGDLTTVSYGRPISLHNDMTSCGAKLISSQQHALKLSGGVGSAEGGFAAMLFGTSESTGTARTPAPIGTSGTSATRATSTGSPSVSPTGLGPQVDALAAKSPTMQKQLADMQRKGITIGYGSTGPSVTNLGGRTPSISIDPAYKNNPQAAASQLSHELGHAENPISPDYSSKNAFLTRQFDNEGAATMNNIQVTREISQAGGPSIGLSASHENVDAYNVVYDEAPVTGDTAAAEQAIGEIYGSNEKTKVFGTNQVESYSKIYGDWYDQRFSH